MNYKKYFSFLSNKNFKLKIIFFTVIIISVTIVFLDTFSIFTLLPLISFATEAGDLQDKFSHLEFLPNALLNFTEALDFKKILLILIVILFVRNLINIFYQYLIFRFVKYLELDTYKKLYYNLINKDYLEFYNQTSNELIKNFQTSTIQYLTYAEIIARITSDTIILFLYFLFLSYLSFNETIGIFVYFLIIFLLLKSLLSNFSFKYGEIYNKTSSKINLTIINTFKNFSQIILRNLKKKYTNVFSDIVIQHSFSRLIVNLLKSVNRQFLEISVLIFILIFFFILDKIYSLSDILALATVYLAAAYRIMPTVNSLISSYVKLKNYEYGFKIIDNQINHFNRKYKKIKFETNKDNKFNFKKFILLKDINFTFNKSKNKILNKLNLKIKKNQMIGIVGRSGSGKTTLIKILLGLIRPTSGQILFDDKKIDYKKRKNFYQLFSYLPQENLFIPGTIKENIGFGEDEIDENKVIEVLKETNCLNFVNRLNKNINHLVKEDGKNFSIGQLQRFALARALYFNTEILILDEPTSALDFHSEKKFIKLISRLKKKKTIIIISHKTSTLKNCDTVYKLIRNKLVKSKK